jgi:GxxExxY protein
LRAGQPGEFTALTFFQEVFMESFLHKELSFQLLGVAYTVHNLMGPGLLEHAYREAMCVELELSGIPYEQEKVYPLEYKGRNIGTYFADIVADNRILLELKSVAEFHPAMEAQIINYLKVSGIEVGYLMNFHNSRVDWKRFVRLR